MQKLLDDCKKAYGERNYSRVELICNRILEQDKSNETALEYKILSLAFLEKDEEVLECADYAINLYPDNYRFYFEKAETLLWAFEDVDGAIECYERGLSLVEDFERHWPSVDNMVIALYRKAESQSHSWESRIPPSSPFLLRSPAQV